MGLSKADAAARLTVIERAIVDLAVLIESLRQDLVDSAQEDVLDS